MVVRLVALFFLVLLWPGFASAQSAALTEAFNVTRNIVAAPAVTLSSGEEQQQAQQETENVQAYDAFLQGWDLYRRFTPDDFVKAIPYFESAVELDPEYGRAYAALAAIYFQSWLRGYEWTAKVNPLDGDYLSYMGALEKSKENLALAMNDPTPLAHQVASGMHSEERQFDEAVAEAERAVSLDPNDPEGYLAHARALVSFGRAEDAVAAAEKAMRLDPHYPASYLFALGTAYLGSERYEEAVATLERALDRNPQTFGMQAPLAVAYAQLGRLKEASVALKRFTDGWSRYTPKIDRVMQYWPFKREADVRRFGGGLVKAGLCCKDLLEQYIEQVRRGGTLE